MDVAGGAVAGVGTEEWKKQAQRDMRVDESGAMRIARR